MLTPYLLTVESQGQCFPHVFYARDAEDAICGAADYLRACWRDATVTTAARLDRERFTRAIGRTKEDARRRVEELLDDPRAGRVETYGAARERDPDDGDPEAVWRVRSGIWSVSTWGRRR